MPRRENPFKEERIRQIKKAAIKLFSERGYHDTTIALISEEAGLGKGTIYWYWKSKDELAFSLVEDMLSSFLGLLDEVVTGEGNFSKKVRELVERATDLYEAEKEHCRLLWKFRADRHYIFKPQYVNKVTRYYVRMREKLAELVEQGVREGEIREVDSGTTALVLLGIVEGLELEWLENEDYFDLRDGLRMVLDAFFKGLKEGKDSEKEGER